ncbi:oxidoreductase [Amycolatopsis suaedae]|uniref:SDR family NAD(P)-dependent oxidoreductase n=1 Tax=Amycolatopsis suaedae TaxID=2510978 RepID=A0A4Q7IYC4_9PSEU|nr:oxidoreductase [Amycolatopsis suaedae]RZQ59437.1 SDR family NAD(P)-dependent oxidoreductase [Amycolatopsis suaedae]
MDFWTEDDIPDQTDRTVLVTGANSGLGLRTATVLAGKGARILLACRSAERGRTALTTVRAAAVGAEPELVSLDLADLASVRAAAETVRASTGDRLDVLVNNAGLMMVPRGRTVDGFETQFGTNHLGHAALTWLLMPALRGGKDARVVTVSSVAAHAGRIDLDDPNYERRRYLPTTAYGQSKLANQVFALELDRRLRAAGDEVISVAAHPGYTSTGLGSGMASSYRHPVIRAVLAAGNKAGELLFAQGTRMGTLPQLYAATAPQVRGGDYIGPHRLGGARGYPVAVRPLRSALDPATGAGLYQLSATMTGITPDPR